MLSVACEVVLAHPRGVGGSHHPGVPPLHMALVAGVLRTALQGLRVVIPLGVGLHHGDDLALVALRALHRPAGCSRGRLDSAVWKWGFVPVAEQRELGCMGYGS